MTLETCEFAQNQIKGGKKSSCSGLAAALGAAAMAGSSPYTTKLAFVCPGHFPGLCFCEASHLPWTGLPSFCQVVFEAGGKGPLVVAQALLRCSLVSP
eukprot:6466324-Amphidinium_carterae.1